jgi:hypothetical protein
MARPEDEVAAGDGLRAFGATLILPVQMHSEGSIAIAGQRFYAKQDLVRWLRLTEKQGHQIRTNRLAPAQPREER